MAHKAPITLFPFKLSAWVLALLVSPELHGLIAIIALEVSQSGFGSKFVKGHKELTVGSSFTLAMAATVLRNTFICRGPNVNI